MARRGFERLVGCLLAHLLESHARQFAPEPHEAFPILGAQRFADRALGLARHHDIEPGCLRALPLGGDNLDGLPIFQARPQGHAHAIHLGAHAAVADAGVDGIGEIERGGAARQLHHIALGREAEDLIGIHLELHMLEEFIRILGSIEMLGEAFEPFRGIHRKGIFRPHPIAVGPVRRHARFRHLVHLAGADLDFDALAVAPRNGRVDRAVAVGFGLADVILETPRNRPPAAMHRPEHAVAIRLAFGNHPKAVYIGKAGKALALFLHLAPDGIGLLRTAEHIRLDPLLLEHLADIVGDLVDHIAGFALKGDEAADDRAARLRVEHPEGQILKLVAHPLHAHAPGERGIDIHGFSRLLHLLLGAHELDRAHVVQAVGELHEDHPEILAHRHEELAEIFRLPGAGGGKLEIGELRHPVHQPGDLLAETVGDLLVGGAGILDGIVQKGGDDRCIVKPLLRQDRSHRHRVLEIFLARMAGLALVHLAAVFIGIANELFIGFRIVVADQRDQPIDINHPPAIQICARDAPAQGWPWASISARSSFSSDMSSSSGLSASAPIRSAIASSSGSSTSICVCRLSIMRSRSSSTGWVSSAISRSATTGFLSFSRSTVMGAPSAISRARCAASRTSSNRFGTLSTQSSTVTRAMSDSISSKDHQKKPV